MRELSVKRGELRGRSATRIFLRGFVAVVFFLISVSVFAQDIPARPVPPRLVNDFANVLSDKQIQLLENKLVRYSDTTSTQICVVTIDDLGGTTTADFAYQIGEKWGVGHKENNGAVILIKPKKSDSDRGGVSIQVGYGLEPFVTDAISKRIIEQEMIPSFRENDYYTAIDKATDVIIGLVTGQFSGEEYQNGDDSIGFAVIIFAFIFIIILIAISKGNNNGGTMGGKDNDGSFWRTLFWLSLLSNSGSRNSGWGGFSGGSGGYGGGGFGGFGGGHFGGGGASGSW